MQAVTLIGQIKEKSFDPVDFCLHEKLKSVTGESSSLSIVLNVLLKKQMMSMSSRSFSLLSLNFPVRASYLNQVFNSITNQYDVYIYELLSTL